MARPWLPPRSRSSPWVMMAEGARSRSPYVMHWSLRLNPKTSTLFLMATVMLLDTSTATAQRTSTHTSALTPTDVTLYARVMSHERSSPVRRGSRTRRPRVPLSADSRGHVTRGRRTRQPRRAMSRCRCCARSSPTPTRQSARTQSFGLGLAHDTTSLASFSSAARVAGPVSAAATWSLSQLGDAAASAITTLLSTRPVLPIRSALLIAASHARSIDLALLGRYLQDRDMTVRWAAAYTISRRHTPQGARMLLGVTRSDNLVRGEIARGLTADVITDSSVRQQALQDAHDAAQRRLSARSCRRTPHGGHVRCCGTSPNHPRYRRSPTPTCASPQSMRWAAYSAQTP